MFRPTTHIHQYIHDQQPLSAITKLNLDAKSLNAKDETNQTPFQLAANYGRLDILALLINKNVRFETISHQVIQDYPLIAKYLAVTTHQQEPVDPIILTAVFFRALYYDEKHVLEYLSKTNDLAEFIEFALERNYPSIAQELMMKSKRLNKDPMAYTAAYWALLNNIKDWRSYCQSEQDWLLTLSQLSATGYYHEFEMVLEAAGAEITKAFFESNEPEEEKISPRFKRAYEAANQDNKIILHHACAADVSHYDIFVYAFKKKNYVALKTIFDVTQHTDLLAELLKNNQMDCALFLVVSSAMDVYSLALKWRHDQLLLTKLIQLGCSETGLLYGLISRCVMKNVFPAAEVVSLIKKLKKQIDIVPIFERCIQHRYSTLSLNDSEWIASLANRIGLIIPTTQVGKEQGLGDLPKDCLQIVLTYVDANTQKTIASISQAYFEQVFYLNPKVQGDRQYRRLGLEAELKLLNRFINAVNNDVESASYRIKYELHLDPFVTFITCGILLLLSIKYLFYCLSSENMVDDRRCSDAGYILNTFALIGLPVLTIVGFEEWAMKYQARCTKHLPINQYSLDVQSIAQEIFEGYTKIKNNPFAHYNLNSMMDAMLSIAIKRQQWILTHLEDKQIQEPLSSTLPQHRT